MSFIKKIGKSFLNLFLFSAIIHNGVLIFSAIKNKNIKYLNYFKIIGLETFWPEIAESRMSDLISIGIMFLILSLFLMMSLKKKNNL